MNRGLQEMDKNKLTEEDTVQCEAVGTTCMSFISDYYTQLVYSTKEYSSRKNTHSTVIIKIFEMH